MKYIIHIFLLVTLIFIVISCQSNTNINAEEETIIQRFLMEPGTSLEDHFGTDSIRFTCSINILNRKGATRRFSYQNSIHFFSDEALKTAKDETVQLVFVFTGDSESGNTWSTEKYKNIVQIAICKLPDVPGIINEMKSRLSNFDQESWVKTSQRNPKFEIHVERADQDSNFDAKPILDMSTQSEFCGGWFCDSYFITTMFIGGIEQYSIIECENWSYETYLCEGGGGGGGSGDFPGVPDPFVGGGGNPGGGDPNYDPCNPSGPMQLPPPECASECDWMDPNLPWMCGSPFEIMIDPSFENNNCLNNVFSTIGGAPTFYEYLQNFDGTFSVAHLRLSEGVVPNYPNANAVTIQPFNYIIEIRFNMNNIGSRPDLSIARIMIHELLHAEMFRKLLSVAQEPSIPWSVSFIEGLSDDFPGLFDYYLRWALNNPTGTPNTAQHQMMADHYRQVIEDVLREFDDSHDDEVYEALAWMGLHQTVAWNALTQQERDDILDEVSYFEGTQPSCSN